MVHTDAGFGPLTRYLGAWLDAAPAVGLTISVTDRNRTLYTANLGFANLEARSPVTADTAFQIGSIGKSMTALAVMQLVESGRLDLNAPASTHLPWFAMPSRFGPITLRHLLSHTAGLPAGSDFAPAARYEGFALRDTEAAWEPGSRYHYSNTAYKLLGWMLEDLTGQDYGSVIRQRVLNPVGMNATHPVITHATRRGMATGYVPLHDDRPYRQNDTLIPATWIEYAVGDGSQVSTAADMARYARLWLNGGRGDIGRVVSPAAYATLTTPVISMAEGGGFPPEYRYCLGIISHIADGHHYIGHGGGTVGFRSIMLTDQTDGLGVVVMCSGSDVNLYPAARHALEYTDAVARGLPRPAAPPPPDPRRVENAGIYAGDYADQRSGSVLHVRVEGDRLALGGPDSPGAVLEHVAGDTFCVPHDGFDPFPLRFRRGNTDGDDAPAVEIHHGSKVYVRQGCEPMEDDAPLPQEWAAFPGHYRSHSPYFPNFRVVARRGRLFLAWPHGGEDPLIPHPSDSGPSPRFLIGPAGEPTAEWLRFDAVVGPRALGVLWAGGGRFYRV